MSLLLKTPNKSFFAISLSDEVLQPFEEDVKLFPVFYIHPSIIVDRVIE